MSGNRINTIPTFSVPTGTGKLMVPVGSSHDYGLSTTLQPDGKIVVAGYSYSNGNNDFSLIRLNADGSRDTGFGDMGTLLVPVGGRDDYANSITLQPDGKIVVAGRSSGSGDFDFSLIRLNADGLLDTSFGGSGKLLVPVGSGHDYGQSVTLQPDGKIVVAGHSGTGIGINTDFGLIRLNADGTPDKSFGHQGDGTLVLPVGSSADSGQSIILQPDGKIVVAGYSQNGSDYDFSLIRLNADGTPDTSFGDQRDGKQLVAVGSGRDEAYGITLQPDGKIVVAGRSDNGSGNDFDFSLIRLNADGSLDTSFGGSGTGKLLVPVGSSSDEARSITLQPDGKIVVTGYGFGDRDNDFGLIRLNADGSPDTSFGDRGDGTLLVSVGSSADYGRSITLQPDGKIVVAGYSYNGSDYDFSLIRLNADGSLDTSFNAPPNPADTLGGTTAYTEKASPVLLDDTVAIFDADLAAQGHYGGSSLTLARSGGADPQDVFGASGNLSLAGGNVTLSGTVIGSFTQTGGSLAISFNSQASQARVNEALSALTYSNTSSNPPATVTIGWTFSDGNAGAQGSGGVQTTTGSTVVNIAAVNDAPVNSIPATQSIVPGMPLVFNAANLNRVSISDVDIAGNQMEVTLSASNGILTLESFNDLTFTVGDGIGDSSMIFRGALSAINTALNGLTFTPTAGYTGFASIGIISNDSGSSGSGGSKYDTDVIDIMVNPLNPSVTSVTSVQPNGSYKAGSTLTLTLFFDQIVNVDGGSPTLLLNVGSPGRFATYASGSGTTTLSFTYTVQAGDTSADLDYLSTTALQLNGATIKSAGGDIAVLTLPTPGAAGSLGAGKNIVIDTTTPAQTFSGLHFSADAGSKGADFITNTVAQTITATLSTGLDAGDKVYGSLDDGANWTEITNKVQGTSLTWDGITLAGSGTLRLKVTDAAGNEGTPQSQTYTLDTTAPVFNPAIGSPADNATSVAVGASLVLSFGEPLGSIDATKIYLHDTQADTTVAISASIDNNGRLVIAPNAALKAGTAYHLTWDAEAIKDVAGNAASALSNATTFNFTTASGPTTPTDPTQPTQPTEPTTPTNPTEPTTPTNPTEPTVPTQPTQPTEVVDGVTVITRPGADGSTITEVPVIAPGRTDLADIPLVKGADDQPILQVSAPSGIGLQAQGLLTASSGEAALNQLSGLISSAGGAANLLADAQAFAQSLPSGAPLYVQKVTLTTGPGFVPGTVLHFDGSTRSGDGQQALILDASALPSGSVIQVDNLAFIAVVGNVRLIGGAGQNQASGDGGTQWMVLGADDDVIHGGAGNDTVGSLGGNDQVFGDAGDDIVFGGTGNDTLSGGNGNDRLDGGLGWDTALQSGALADYTLRTDGQFLVLTHKTTGEVDRLKSIETVKFDTGANLYIADSDAEAALAHIVTRWLGRELTADEGVWAQKNSTLSDLQVAQYMLGAHAAALQGHTAQELVAGWQANSQIVRMHVASELMQGTAGLDQVRIGLMKGDVHLARTGTDRWEGTSLIDGDMAEFVGIERLHLKDVSVALDTQGTAGKVAALLSVTLGNSYLADKGLAGEGLKALDWGMSVQAVGEIAMRFAQTQQGHQFTAQETVQWLWTKATGSAGTQEQLQPYVQQLQNGQITTGDLVNAAVHHALAHPSAQLVGVLDGGLLYTA